MPSLFPDQKWQGYHYQHSLYVYAHVCGVCVSSLNAVLLCTSQHRGHSIYHKGAILFSWAPWTQGLEFVAIVQATNISMRTYGNVYAYTHTFMQTHPCSSKNIHTHTSAYTYTYTQTWIHTPAHLHTCTHTHTYTHMYTHTLRAHAVHTKLCVPILLRQQANIETNYRHRRNVRGITCGVWACVCACAWVCACMSRLILKPITDTGGMCVASPVGCGRVFVHVHEYVRAWVG